MSPEHRYFLKNCFIWRNECEVMEKEDFLPILWFQEEPIMIYVINNKLIGSHIGTGYVFGNSGKPALNLIKQLYDSSLSRNTIPTDFHIFFHKQPAIELPKKDYSYVLGYRDPQAGVPYMNFEVKILQKHVKPVVLFHNFTYKNEPIKLEFKLSSQEAFLLLSNIILSSNTRRFYEILWKNSFDSIKEFIRDNTPDKWLEFFFDYLQNLHHRGPESLRSSLERSYLHHEKPEVVQFLFSITYLNYLWTQIKAGLLSPAQILRLNGMLPLVYLMNDLPPVFKLLKTVMKQVQKLKKLSTNQKILYLTFLEICRHRLSWFDQQAEPYQLLTNFYKTHSNIFQKLRNELSIPFPHKKEEIDYIFNK